MMHPLHISLYLIKVKFRPHQKQQMKLYSIQNDIYSYASILNNIL
jgi:hypothetical protein